MAITEFSGFEIEPYDRGGVWYTRFREKGSQTFRSSQVLLDMPADTEAHAIEIAKSLIDSGTIS